MAGLYDSIVSYAERSDYMDVEHLWPLGFGISVVLISVADIDVLTQILAYPDSFTELRELLVMALKGVVAGMIVHFAYSTSDISFKAGSSLQSKERALGIVVGVSVGAGLLLDVVIPWLVDLFPYVVVQTSGLLFLLGMWYVHWLVSNWKLENEGPHLLSGVLIAFGPYIPYIL